MDVLSHYLFDFLTFNQNAKTIAKVNIIIMTKHAYLPTTFISYKWSAFLSHSIE